jgi:hypothetical protein
MPLLTAQLGLASTLVLDGIQHSIALFTMGDSGAGKSMEIKAFTGVKHHERVLRADKFTISSLLSGYGERKSEELEQDSLFKRARHRVMVTSELARIFRGRTTGILEERFGELAGWLDGEGIVSWTGTHGQQGAEGDYTCVWIGNTTPFYLKTWRTMERLGQRLLFYPASQITTDQEVPEEELGAAVEDLRSAARGVLDTLFEQHRPRSVRPWPKLPTAVDQEINRLTELLADGHIIGVGNIASEGEAATRPDVKHFRSRIKELVSGVVWVTGRREADETDIQNVVRPIVWRSMPQSRGPVLLALYDGLHEVRDIAAATGLAGPTVDRTLNELEVMGVVRRDVATASRVGAPAGSWFLTREA